jgi:hypothetical protein
MKGEEEVGRGSLWLLRALSVLVILVLVFFLVGAIIG